MNLFVIALMLFRNQHEIGCKYILSAKNNDSLKWRNRNEESRIQAFKKFIVYYFTAKLIASL